MSRSADSTVKGFLYQFNKTILAIAESDSDEIITVEGLIEDIDINNADGSVKAVQCKYHETVDAFTESIIYKPLLQMAESFSKSAAQVTYRIFIHIANEVHGERQVTSSLLDNALLTKNEKLLKIIERISPSFDKTEFLKVITLEFGPSLTDLEDITRAALGKLDIRNSDVECLLYPNSISHIAKLSSQKDSQNREITKAGLTKYLSSITVTAISKWILASKSKAKIMLEVRKQLRNGLCQNSRSRHIYFSPNAVDDFDSEIVLFINNYFKKYCTKATHTKSPLFSIECDLPTIKNLQHRLYKKGIKATTGMVGDIFEITELFREPISVQNHDRSTTREFDLRLHSTQNGIEILNQRKSDDLYVVASKLPSDIETTDINLHQLGISNFKELEYVMQLGDAYE